MRIFAFIAAFVAAMSGLEAVWAETPGMALPWQLGLQTPATPVMHRLYELHDWLTILITIITLFVLGLLLVVCVRFSARRNPTPSKTAHNTLIEILWTALPILILVGIAIPSLRIHYFMDRAHEAQMTLKVTGRQWYWSYEYPDQGDISYDSNIVPAQGKKQSPEQDRAELKGEPRLLSVDNPVVVPVNTVVRVLVTGADVIHSWAVPAFGIKIDAIPGRVNETWFRAEKIGTYRGQCSQLCGPWHGFMPIVVKVVSAQDFTAWVSLKRKSALDEGGKTLKIAAAQ
jgi:cytochrome c oxidase subunit 2